MADATVVSASPPAVAVRLSDVRKRYGSRDAVSGVTLAVPAGEIYGLIGPDGAGKSTIMKTIAGVLAHDGGDVDVLGTRVDSEQAAERIKSRLGFMPQGLGLNLYPDLSVDENIDFFARLRLVPPAVLAARKRTLLAMTRLAPFASRPMRHLSGGMKQKLALTCTLVHEPELLILDEPTTGVDPVSRRDFWAILAELLRERHLTALVSTAYMDEASRFHRLALMSGGRIIAEGAPDEVRGLVKGRVVTARAAPQDAALRRLGPVVPEVEVQGPFVRVLVPETDPSVAEARVRDHLGGLAVSELTVDDPQLEDVFVALSRETGTGAGAAGEPATVVHARSEDRAIEAVGLTRDFGAFRAVAGVSFAVRPGEIFGLLGANGAGKTTVIKMLTGILRPTAGTGHVAGVDMRRPARAIKKRIGYMSQAFSLYHDLTVVENVRLYGGIYGLGRAELRERLDWILAIGGLGGHEDAPAGGLPMGMRQRLALGCALVHRPQALFLDEPTSGVDPVGRRRFWRILAGLARDEGVAILVTTHYMAEAEHCDRLGLMFAGRLVADASPADMKRQVAAEAGQVLELSVDRPAVALQRLAAAGLDVALHGPRVHLLSRDVARDTARVAGLLSASGLALAGVAPRRLTMEDVFVYRVTALERAAEGAR